MGKAFELIRSVSGILRVDEAFKEVDQMVKTINTL
jgi:hypothetical protein